MAASLGNYRGTWSDFLDLYMRGYLVHGSWFDHVLPYFKFHQEHPDRMFFTSFEDLKLVRYESEDYLFFSLYFTIYCWHPFMQLGKSYHLGNFEFTILNSNLGG
ncbi:hypothetical protein AVEN_274640-1 [Araneus ventricosus]|uniref:Sulfotransferase domain-containing protein n=1 Tax=Araneus ventricosus TaxID=182803 RepID=A0A4Y2W4Q7_ARAVE|nr:hypothetical protein AVEN_274640-1 [Araneus ventricosus]